MQNNELITIGIPVYNMENSIKKAIDSCLAQTYKNFEILIVNDGSKDNSIQVVKENYKTELDSNKIRIYERPQNGGVCMAMGDLVEQAKGVYIAFLDADDTMMNTRIEEQYNAIKLAEIEHPEQMVASFCGSLVNHITNKTTYVINPSKLFLNEEDGFGGGTGHSMYKVKNLLQLGNFDPNFSRSSDAVMCLNFLINGGYYAMIDKQLIQYNFIWNKQKRKLEKQDRKNLKKKISINYQLDAIKNLNNVYLNRYFDISTTNYIKLFNLNLLKIIETKAITKYYLFNVLPIFREKIKMKNKIKKYYLFNILPIWFKRIK